MAMRPLRLGLLIAAAVIPADVAFADPPVMIMVAAPDPDRVAVARQIVAIVLPPDRAMAIMGSITDSVMRPIEAQMHTQLGTDDPGLNAIFNDFLRTIPGSLRATIEPMMPDMVEAMAQAYARTFTREELAQVLAFGQTPAGAKYLSRASDLVKDASVQAFYARLVPAIQAQQAPLVADFKRKLSDYLAAHPDVAKKMKAASAH